MAKIGRRRIQFLTPRKTRYVVPSNITTWSKRLAAIARTSAVGYNAAKAIYDKYKGSKSSGSSSAMQSDGGQYYPQPRASSSVSMAPSNSVGAMRQVAYGTTGRSAGFITSRKKVRTKKHKTVRKIIRNGVFKTREFGGVTAPAGELAIIGHTTCGTQLVMEALTLALVKCVFNAHHVAMPDVRRFLVDDYNYIVGDTFRITYLSIPNAGTISNLDYVIKATDTPESLATAIQSKFDTVVGIQEISFVSFQFFPYAVSAPAHPWISFNLIGARFHWDIKSSLKLQNRTVTAADDDNAFDVNNSPLYGKSYMGKGTGSKYVTPYSYSAGMQNPPIANTFGLISLGSSIIPGESIQEPPFPDMFTDVKSYGKVRIEPGAIQTSVLTHRSSSTLDALWRSLITSSTPSTSLAIARYRKIGKFRFIALEKIINSSATEPGIQIAFELNTRYGGYFSFSTQKKTAEVFAKTYL